MGLLIFLLLLALGAWLGFYIISQMGLPPQPALIARIALGVLLLIVLLQEFGLHYGGFYVRY